MIEDVDIETYLRERSSSVEVVGDEQRYSHSAGCSSILVRRRNDHPMPVFPAASPLRSFYERFSGASIGDSDLMLATPVAGGFALSAGYSLPDFAQVRGVAADYSVQPSDDEFLFMVTYGWMWFYGYVGSQLRVHDRDFHTTDDRTFRQVLDDWWQIASENPT